MLAGFEPLRDIRGDTEQPGRAAGLVTHRERALRDPPDRSVGPDDPILQLVGLPLAGARSGPLPRARSGPLPRTRRLDPPAILRVNGREEGSKAGVQRFPTPAPDAFVGRTHVHEPARLPIPDPEHLPSGSGQQPETALALLQPLLGRTPRNGDEPETQAEDDQRRERGQPDKSTRRAPLHLAKLVHPGKPHGLGLGDGIFQSFGRQANLPIHGLHGRKLAQELRRVAGLIEEEPLLGRMPCGGPVSYIAQGGHDRGSHAARERGELHQSAVLRRPCPAVPHLVGDVAIQQVAAGRRRLPVQGGTQLHAEPPRRSEILVELGARRFDALPETRRYERQSGDGGDQEGGRSHEGEEGSPRPAPGGELGPIGRSHPTTFGYSTDVHPTGRESAAALLENHARRTLPGQAPRRQMRASSPSTLHTSATSPESPPWISTLASNQP